MIALFALLVVAASQVQASHSWGTYHWARTSNPFTLKLGDNLTSTWDPYLASASAGWSTSTVLNTTVVTGVSNPKRCQPSSGRIEVCNSKYGNNGWLGIAQIWIAGDHITQGVTKLNDTYFTTQKYNTPAWKNLVMCQEVGHTFGLDHQDENFANPNLGTCMDYTDDPSGVLKGQADNETPNQHDYDQLASIYAHLDTTTTIQSGTQKLPLGQSVSEIVSTGDFEDRASWGRQIRDNGHVAQFERVVGNQKLYTFVIWAQ